jgi:hypothetical protein
MGHDCAAAVWVSTRAFTLDLVCEQLRDPDTARLVRRLLRARSSSIG